MNNLLCFGFIVLLLLFGLLVLLIYLVCTITDLYYNTKEKIFTKKYPKYCLFSKEYSRLLDRYIKLHNTNISDNERKIDKLLMSLAYLNEGSEMYIKTTNEIEDLRGTIENCITRLKEIDDETYNLVQDNKKTIEEIRYYDKKLYESWTNNNYFIGKE